MKIPNYRRQRFVLALLDRAHRPVTKMDIQKLTFLMCHQSEESFYDFVPYHYGCYSFQLQSDLDLLMKRGWLSVSENSQVLQLSEPVTPKIKAVFSDPLELRLEHYKTLRGNELVRHVYQRYPYFATRSRIARSILSTEDYKKVEAEKSKAKHKGNWLFTIGYEGRSIEDYVNVLLTNNVQLLCDVRKNPYSRKFGYSKRTLEVLLPKFDIAYRHMPELGIESIARQGLETRQDRVRLFDHYRETLPNHHESICQIKGLFDTYERIALTCFEREQHDCHRHCISDYMSTNMAQRVCHL